jgi:hypothetical protein
VRLDAVDILEAFCVASVDFPLTADEGTDDLPRTLRREREARQRAAREKEDKARAATLTHDFGMSDERSSKSYAVDAATGTVVTRFDVPFGHLMLFSIKAVLAAIPALILLGVLLWFAGALLKAYYPELVHMQILINFPKAT